MSSISLCNDNFHDIYLDLLHAHLSDYDYENIPRDSRQFEKLYSSFTLTNPIERVCYAKERKVNIFFQLAEVLWYLNGSNSLSFISYYAPKITIYSKDKETLTGTAYGPKIFSWNTRIDQMNNVFKELKRHPDSRRAVIQVFDPAELCDSENIDVSCTLSMQFLVREQRLNMITTMRSNDVYRGILSDVFSFTFLQELMSKKLGLELGEYHHQVGSTHVYENDLLGARKVGSSKTKFCLYGLKYDKMPDRIEDDVIKIVLHYENEMRNNKPLPKLYSISKYKFDTYWENLLTMFEIFRRWKYENLVDANLISGLSQTFKYLVNNYFGVKPNEC